MSDTSFTSAARLVRSLIRPHLKPFSVAVFGSLLYAGGTVAGTIILGRAVDDVVLPVFDEGASLADTSMATWAILIVVVAIVRVAGVGARRYFAGMTAEQVSLRFRRDLSNSYVRLPMEFHRERHPGDLLAHIDADTEKVTEVLHPLPFALAALFMVIFAAMSVVVVDLQLALIGFVVFPILIGMNRLYSKRVEVAATAQQHAVGQVTSVAHESFDGALVVKLLGRESHESQRFEHEAEILRTHRARVGDLRALFESGLDALPSLGIVGVMIAGGWRVNAGAITVGELVQVAALFSVLGFPVRVFGYFLENVAPSFAGRRRLATVLDVAFPAPRANLKVPDGPLNLSVRGLTVRYGDQTVLSDVDLDVAGGEVVALVGATGSGKSTLVDAIAGLIEPSDGDITLNGVSRRDLDPADVADAVSFAFQEAFLFVDSVQDNVALGRDGIGANEVNAALSMAQAATFVAQLPDGSSTVVGERGLSLSGGQRQRVALARALAGSPRLVVLDDATSAVDARIERRILDALHSSPEAPGMLVVAHRLSTIKLADRVVFIKDGRVVDTGPHDELLTNPDYLALATAYEQAEDQ